MKCKKCGGDMEQSNATTWKGPDKLVGTVPILECRDCGHYERNNNITKLDV